MRQSRLSNAISGQVIGTLRCCKSRYAAFIKLSFLGLRSAVTAENCPQVDKVLLSIKRPIVKVAIRIITKVAKSCVAALAGSFLGLQSGGNDHETHFDCWGWTGWNDHGL